MTAYWLFKSEPSTWSWAQQSAEPPQPAEWSGVRNHSAKLHLQAMRIGDRGFFYHSMTEKAVVGIVRVTVAAHSDSTDPTGRWVAVDIVAERALPTPVALARIKAEPALAAMALVRLSRLSVQPVTPAEWERVCALGGLAGVAD